MIDMIDTILTFLEAHWELILHIVLLLVSSVLFIVRKKPVTSFYAELITWSIGAVSLAEMTGLKGSEKMNYAVGIVFDQIHAKYPELDFSKYRHDICCIIEAILSTPQKKV